MELVQALEGNRRGRLFWSCREKALAEELFVIVGVVGSVSNAGWTAAKRDLDFVDPGRMQDIHLAIRLRLGTRTSAVSQMKDETQFDKRRVFPKRAIPSLPTEFVNIFL